jgi:hypothetical protein
VIELAFVLGKNNAGDVSVQLNGIILRAIFSPQRKLVSLEAKKPACYCYTAIVMLATVRLTESPAFPVTNDFEPLCRKATAFTCP